MTVSPLPSPLQPGDIIGVVAPASAPKDPSKLTAGIAHLESLGYRVQLGRSDLQSCGYLAGPDPERLDEFNRFLRRQDVKALFCARGGYGTLRLLPHLDYAAARRHPKLLVGYSDITALHLALFHMAGWRGLSGPMLAVEWGDIDPRAERSFWSLARGETPRPLLGPHGEELRPVRTGVAEGVLLGGNLSTVVRLLGTPYLPSLEGALLFVEEVGEQPYRIDALLAQLKLSGVLDKLGGMILGGITEWQPPENRPTLTPEEVVAHYLGEVPYPVATGLVYGHFPVKSTVPIGVRGRLEVTEGSAALSILTPVVS
ncbi:MAG: LD-carboxypeptidase [Rhodothermales bacterium]